MNHKWNYQSPTELECIKAERLSDEIGISPVLCRLLRKRGVQTAAEAKKFFRPSLLDLHDPFLMDGMDAAVARINKALGRKERILVYGDYDVDGTTAVALVYRFLQQFTTNIAYYIPDRDNDGYGVSFKSVEYAKETGVSLVIVLDCGVKAEVNCTVTDVAALKKDYDAVLVAVGAWKSTSIGCEGDKLEGVLGGIDVLREVNLGGRPDLGKNVAVVGGGNVAMDAARCALRLGAEEVSIVYRRSLEELPARKEEVEHAMEEGIEFLLLHRFGADEWEVALKPGRKAKIGLGTMSILDYHYGDVLCNIPEEYYMIMNNHTRNHM